MATRVHAQYTDDAGTDIQLTTLDYIATAGGLTVPFAGPRRPAGLIPRHLNWKANAGGQKHRIWVQASAAAWTNPAPFALTVNGVAGTVTGHSGERRIGQ